MSQYEKASMEIIELLRTDVIRTSGEDDLIDTETESNGWVPKQ